MCNFRLAKKYGKTVQIEVKVYTDVAGPMTEQGKLKNLVSDTGDQRNSCFKKDCVHVDQSTSGTNGLNIMKQLVSFFLSFADISLCQPPQEGGREQLIIGNPCQYI